MWDNSLRHLFRDLSRNQISSNLPFNPTGTDSAPRKQGLNSFSPAPPVHHDGAQAELQRELRSALDKIALLEEQLRSHARELLTSRREGEESMLALNRVLNARVAQRTRELELALESEQEARREAELANRIKSELFARLSHEFRTPLHAVSGYLEILQQNIHGMLTLDQRRDIERIHQAQEHLLALVNMILDFAKLEGGPVELSMAEIPVEETLRSAEALVAPQLAKKGIEYSHRSGDRTVSVFADREKVQQIIVNILANAVKFTPPGGTVDLEWNVENDTLHVRIRDTGIGIPADMTEQIFEPFVQLRPPGSPLAGGTGLGLPISRDLARAMGGDVRVTSTFGRGSVFTLLLPLRKRAGGKLPAP